MNEDRYRPCRTGLHVCGADHEANEFFTVVDFPLRRWATALAVYHRAECECHLNQGEPMELVVDLMSCGDIVADFAMTRQMLERFCAVVKESLETMGEAIPA